MTSSRSPHRSWTTWSGSKTVTGAPDARSAASRAGLLPCLLAVAGLASGCATTPPKQDPPVDPASTPATAAVPAAPAENEAPSAPAQPKPESKPEPEPAAAQKSDQDGPLVVVKPGGKTGEGASTSALVEASRTERERRAKAGQPRLVINDKNLPKYATGTLTFMEPERQKEGEAANAAEIARKEAYWRQRGLEIRQRWRQLADEVKDLETSTADWRQRFYAQDDPYVRDGKIKPEWDRALDRLAQTRRQVDTVRQELEQYMEEGRRAGALPGWLRAGTELEPKTEAAKKEETVDPQEPSVYEEKTKHE